MTEEKKRKLLEREIGRHREFAGQCETAKHYYANENDIKRSGTGAAPQGGGLSRNPLRCSDYRISHNWHSLLVNQKASYLFTYAPAFDTGDAEKNGQIRALLGKDFGKKVKDLCIEASNCGVAWLFAWVDENDGLRLSVMESEQIVPIFTDDLEEKLEYVVRYYDDTDEDGNAVTKYELWDDHGVEFFIRRQRAGLDDSDLLEPCDEAYEHSFGRVPFIPFYNNGTHTGDLPMYQDLIDQYDRVVSGYANDLTDIQEIIFVVRNYGGEDLGVFLSELKKYKAIKVDGDNSDGGVETMQIQIPVEARMEFLRLLKDQIFISGHGVYPDHETLSSTSGVALKYMYSLLEIKAGLMEVEFQSAFCALVQMVLNWAGTSWDGQLKQTFKRNSIENDSEIAQMCENGREILSRETILQNHPWVEDPEDEIFRMKKEQMF